MLKTTIGQLMINNALPEDMQDHTRVLDKKAIEKLFQELADKHPEQYREVAHKLFDVSRNFAFMRGGFSFGARHLQTAKSAVKVRDIINKQIASLAMNRNLTDDERDDKIVSLAASHIEGLNKSVMEEAEADNNPLARQVRSGSRGSIGNIRSLIGGDLLYTDHRDRPIPIPVTNSYSAGLTPAQYFAASFGARRGIMDVQFATQNAGYFSKQLNQSAHRLVIAGYDGDHDPENPQGMPASSDDPDNEGALLAADTGPYRRNTVITPKVLKYLQGKGIKDILVRSPILHGPAEGGLYALDAGVRERGTVSPLGDNVGMAAAQALSEKISQGQLCLHGSTLVAQPEYGSKLIQDMVPGDPVLAFDIKQWKVVPSRVVAVHKNGPRKTYIYLFNYRSVICTKEHKFLSQVSRPDNSEVPEKVAIETLRKYPQLHNTVLASTRGGHAWSVRGLSIQEPLELAESEVYDLEIEHPDHLFVLANGLVSENSSKHSGGVKTTATENYVGFKLLNQLVQVPETFRYGATHADVDGKVENIRTAPQGGNYIHINGQEHYVAPNTAIKVKPGDTVEAGDVLSDGIPNPSEIVKHKGVGEGRRYFAMQFAQAMRDSGMGVHRRNTEIMARGLIDHVRMTHEYGDYNPDQLVPYSWISGVWKPRPDAERLDLNSVAGKYLETPVLHYTIGTKLRPGVIKELQKYGVKRVTAHKEPPPFQPEMVRGADNVSHDPDWMTRFLGSNFNRSILGAAQLGGTSDSRGTSFVPAMIDIENFGKNMPVQDWHRTPAIPKPLDDLATGSTFMPSKKKSVLD